MSCLKKRKAVRLLAQNLTAHMAFSAKGYEKWRHHYSMMDARVQVSFYSPEPGLVAYAAYKGQRGKYEILVSPMECNDRGVWFEDKVPGVWGSLDEAQLFLDALADEAGWPLVMI